VFAKLTGFVYPGDDKGVDRAGSSQHNHGSLEDRYPEIDAVLKNLLVLAKAEIGCAAFECLSKITNLMAS